MLELDIGKIEQQAQAVGENWKSVEAALARAADKCGGPIVAQIDLPGAIEDKWRAEYKMLPRRFTRAQITVYRGGQVDVLIGVEGKNGLFFPEPELAPAQRMVGIMCRWRNLAVWLGGAQKFVDAVMSAALAASALKSKP